MNEDALGLKCLSYRHITSWELRRERFKEKNGAALFL
jgi:hypothetical protein